MKPLRKGWDVGGEGRNLGQIKVSYLLMKLLKEVAINLSLRCYLFKSYEDNFGDLDPSPLAPSSDV